MLRLRSGTTQYIICSPKMFTLSKRPAFWQNTKITGGLPYLAYFLNTGEGDRRHMKVNGMLNININHPQHS